MMTRPNLVSFSALVLAATFLMFSCAFSSPPDRLTVHLSAHRKVRTLHVDTCVSGAPAHDVYADEGGTAKTSMCPASNHNVELEVVEEDNRHYQVPTDEVQVRRTGDGIATSVEASLPP